MLQIPVWTVPLSSPFSFIYIFILFYNAVLSLGFGGQLAYKFVSINLPQFFFPLFASNNFFKENASGIMGGFFKAYSDF